MATGYEGGGELLRLFHWRVICGLVDDVKRPVKLCAGGLGNLQVCPGVTSWALSIP